VTREEPKIENNQSNVKIPSDASDSVMKSYTKYDNHDVVADEPEGKVEGKKVKKVSMKTSEASELCTNTSLLIVLVLGILTPRLSRCL